MSPPDDHSASIANISEHPNYLDVDRSGVTMTWKTAVIILGVTATVVAAWFTFQNRVITTTGLEEHDASPMAHASATPLLRHHGEELAKLRTITVRVEEAVNENATEVESVKDGLIQFRAESLADRAADLAPPRRKVQCWRQTREQALKNLKSGEPIRTGVSCDL